MWNVVDCWVSFAACHRHKASEFDLEIWLNNQSSVYRLANCTFKSTCRLIDGKNLLSIFFFLTFFHSCYETWHWWRHMCPYRQRIDCGCLWQSPVCTSYQPLHQSVSKCDKHFLHCSSYWEAGRLFLFLVTPLFNIHQKRGRCQQGQMALCTTRLNAAQVFLTSLIAKQMSDRSRARYILISSLVSQPTRIWTHSAYGHSHTHMFIASCVKDIKVSYYYW